jgi:hypothetical protein
MNNVVAFDSMLQDEVMCCTINSEFETPLYQACREELTHLLGEDGYALLDEHYATRSQSAASATEMTIDSRWVQGSRFKTQVPEP